MIMRKEKDGLVITKHIGSTSEEIITLVENKKSGYVKEIIEPLKKYSQHPTGYKNQLLEQGFQLMKMRGGHDDICEAID